MSKFISDFFKMFIIGLKISLLVAIVSSPIVIGIVLENILYVFLIFISIPFGYAVAQKLFN